MARKLRTPRRRFPNRLGTLVQLEDRTTPTTFTVNSALDTVVPNDGLVTLREALQAANTNTDLGDPDLTAGDDDGDVIVFDSTVFAAATTITLTGGDLPVADDVLIDGVTGSGGGATVVIVDGGAASRVFSVDTDGAPGDIAVTLTGLTIQNGTGTGTVAANDGLGGAVFISDDEDVTITDSIVQTSTADSKGGGIFNGNGSLALTNVTLGAMVLANGNVAAGAAADEGGGGLYNLGGTVTIDNGTIQNNQATGTKGSGGGILNNGGTVTITNGSISLNVAQRAGGGIEDNANTAATTVTLTDVTVAGNVVGANPGNGGGLHVTAPTGSPGSTVNVNGGSFDSNEAAAEGGGLWGDAGGTLTIDGTTITTNKASGAAADQGGGGVFNNGGILNITNAIITNNQADGTAGSGGGVLSDGGTLSVTGGTIDGNTAVRAGGGIEVTAANNPFTAAVTDATISNNAAGAAPGNGGGIHVTDPAGGSTGTIDVSGGVISGNTAAREGGGLWNDAESIMTVTGVTIQGNTASGPAADDGGGGIFNNGGKLIVDNATITANTADGTSGSGGGIQNLGGTVTITGGTISGNTAQRAGGGIEDNAATAATTISLTDVTVSGNAAGANPGNGGGLHITAPAGSMGSTVSVAGGQFNGNTAAREGGGLWADANSTLTVTGVMIQGNTASGPAADDGGGGIFNNGGKLIVDNSTITANTADGTSGSGGGIQNLGGTVTVTGGSISLNQAMRAGGGIEDNATTAATTVSLTNVTVSGNTVGANPGNGGGLHVTAPAGSMGSTVTVSGGSFTSNIAAREGGGLWGDANGTLTVTNTIISGNVANGPAADDGGGGLFNNGGKLVIENAVIVANEAAGAKGSGGGVQNLGGTVTITGGTIAGNKAQRAGGGIEDNSTDAATTVTLTDVAVIGNFAGPSPGNGGGLHVTAAAGAKESTVTISGGQFTSNTADQEGGGLWGDANGTLSIDGTAISKNTANAANAAADDQGGGGVFNNGGKMIIANATISQNVSLGGDPTFDDGGGGLFNRAGGTVAITDSTISDNLATTGKGNGGGILNIGAGSTVDVTGGTISGNKSARAGGGIETNGGVVTLTNVSLTGNTAGVNGGAVHTSAADTVTAVDSTFDANIAANEGGGLWNASDPAAVITLTSSTVSNNKAAFGGGLFNDGTDGTIAVINSTVSGNTATTDGGGLDSEGGVVDLDNSTFANNTAGTNGGGLNLDAGTTVTADSTLIALNTAPTGPDVNGELTANFSLIGDTAGATITGADNVTGVDPLLGPLADNGGVTFTQALLEGSPAIDKGSNTLNLATDQRGTGFPRVLGTAADIGAFEATPNAAPTITDVPDQTTTVGVAVSATFTVADAETPADALVVTGKSDNQDLVPDASIVITGTGGDRTVTVTPADGETGMATITLTVTDGGGLTATDTFVITVNEAPANTAPVISDIPDQKAAPGVATTASFVIADAETSGDLLQVTPATSDPVIIPVENITIGGTGNARTVTFTPADGQTGTVTITLTVTDEGGLTATDSFVVTVADPAAQTPPTISDIPNQTTTTGTAIGPVAFTIGDAETPAAQLTITVASSNPTLVPVANVGIGGSGTDRTLFVVPAAGQTGTATISLTVTDADGKTASDAFTVTVSAAGTPTITPIANQTTPQGTPVTVSFTVGDDATPAGQLIVTAASDNPTLVPAAGIVVGGSDANRTVTITPAAGQTGTATITVTVTDGDQQSATEQFTLTVTALVPGTPVLVGFPQFGVGSDVGAGSVTYFNADKSVRFSISPFGSTFAGGVRTAAADFNGDGVADLVVGTGPGVATLVRVLDGVTQEELFSVAPFEASFTGGVFVSAGDVTGDGKADLVISPDQGGGPRVRVFDGNGFAQLADFFGIADPNFRGGARTAVGDVNGDGVGDLVVAAGFQGGPRIATFNGKTLGGGQTPQVLFNDFFAFEDTLRNGTFVAAGDVDGDGFADIVAGGGPGGGPRVTVFSGKNLVTSGGATLTPLANFFGGDPDNRGGIRVAVKNLDGDTKADLVVGSGEGAGSRVTSYLGKNITPAGTPVANFDFDAFPGFTGGVFVG